MSAGEEIEIGEKRLILICDLEKCTGCRVCELVCSFEKEKCFDPSKARIRVARPSPTLSGALACTLCTEARCIKSCPTEAIAKTQKGNIAVDKSKCVRCGWCVYACDLGAISYDLEQNVPILCDLCDGEPKCVEICPEEALKFEEVDAVVTKRTILRLKELLR